MKNAKRIIVLALCVLFLLTVFAGCTKTPQNGNSGNGNSGNGTGSTPKSDFPIYSDTIAAVNEIAMLTGPKALPDTRTGWNVGSTDLGIPYWDEEQQTMFFWFGDTFSGINMTNYKGSNVLGYTTDFDASDGITWDGFSGKFADYAEELIPSVKDHSNNGEYTTIPTGAIVIDGVHYCFYMDVKDWQSGWHTNFCNVAKSTDGGKNFEKLPQLLWVNDTAIGRTNAVKYLKDIGVTSAFAKQQAAPNFQQIFPYEKDGYIYLFGITEGRTGGCKLGRVAKDKFEEIEEYEYYYNGSWFKGKDGLAKVKNPNDQAGYIVLPSVSELTVAYNKYLNKYMMTYLTNSAIIYRTSDDLIHWSKAEKIITNVEFVQLYGGFIHEKYMSEDGKTVYFFMSRWYSNGNEGDDLDKFYNVRVMSFTLK